MRLRNILISIIFCCFLLGPVGILAAQVTGVNLPGWLTAEDSSYLEGGMTKSKLMKNLSVKGFFDKKLQTSIETEVGNNVPMKAASLLVNASLQRAAITASNGLFGWESYPSYYGSERVYSSSQNALYRFPSKRLDDAKKRLQSFIAGVCAVAKEYPDTRFAIYVSDSASYSAANPVRDLVTSYRQITTSEIAAYMEEACDAPNVSIAANPIDSSDEYAQKFYKSDHHWNMIGATEGFDTISDELGRAAIEQVSYSEISGPLFYGSDAREGLDLLYDIPFDIDCDFSGVEYREGDAWFAGDDHHTYFDASQLEQQYKFYNLYWPRDGQLKGPGEGTLMLISDSYGDCIRRLFALDRARVIPKTTLHESSKTDDRLRDYIEKDAPEEVVFIGGPSNYFSFQKRNPDFFN